MEIFYDVLPWGMEPINLDPFDWFCYFISFIILVNSCWLGQNYFLPEVASRRGVNALLSTWLTLKDEPVWVGGLYFWFKSLLWPDYEVILICYNFWWPFLYIEFKSLLLFKDPPKLSERSFKPWLRPLIGDLDALIPFF